MYPSASPYRLIPARSLAACALLGLLLCNACAGHTAAELVQPGPAAAGAGLAALPAPSALPGQPGPARGVSYTESDLQKDGHEIEIFLPSSFISGDGTRLDFQPPVQGGTQPGDGSFAIYSFSLSGYDRDPHMSFNWTSKPGAGQLWLAVANWQLDRWDWLHPGDVTRAALASLAPYIKGDGSFELLVYCAVDAQLGSLRIGTLPPVASFTATPPTGAPGLSVSFDAGASHDPDGSIVNYEWDLDGDGLYEQSGAALKTPQQDYPLAGYYPVSLRVTDNNGAKAVLNSAVRVLSDWTHSWGGAQIDTLTASAYDGKDGLYFAGYTQSFGSGGTDLLLLKYSLKGTLKWARSWGSNLGEISSAMCIDGDGNIMLAGNDPGSAILLVKFDPDGNALLATKTSATVGLGFGGLNTKAIMAYGGAYYIAGAAGGLMPPQDPQLGLLGKFDASGNVQWLHTYNSGLGTELNAIDVWAPLFGAATVYAAGDNSDDVLLLQLGSDGSLSKAQSWGAQSTLEQASSILVSGLSSPSIWLAGLNTVEGQLGSRALLLQYSSDLPFARSWGAGGAEKGTGLIATTSGFCVTGNTDSFSATHNGLALSFGSNASFVSSQRLSRPGFDTLFGGSSCTVAGAALVCCGSSGVAQAQSWTTAPGNDNSLSQSWKDASGTYADLSPTTSAASGAATTPSSPVLDTGAGSDDALAALHVL